MKITKIIKNGTFTKYEYDSGAVITEFSDMIIYYYNGDRIVLDRHLNIFTHENNKKMGVLNIPDFTEAEEDELFQYSLLYAEWEELLCIQKIIRRLIKDI